ncbi:MAG: hypothetical protein O6909_07265, partial [Alphaproteobacteria bacterium]|nr:hypothetical protein [Alphaproteobacteria bacterium]
RDGKIVHPALLPKNEAGDEVQNEAGDEVKIRSEAAEEAATKPSSAAPPESPEPDPDIPTEEGA